MLRVWAQSSGHQVLWYSQWLIIVSDTYLEWTGAYNKWLMKSFIYNNFSFSCHPFGSIGFPSSFVHSSISLLGWISACLIFLNEYFHTFNHLLESFIDSHSFKSTRLQEPHIILKGKLLPVFLCFTVKLLFNDLYCLRSHLFPINRQVTSSEAKLFNYLIHFSRF